MKMNAVSAALAVLTLTVAISSVGSAQESPKLPAIPTPRTAAPELRVDDTLLNDLQPPRRPRLGLVVEELTPQLAQHLGVIKGVYVITVDENGPAHQAGITSGDLIVKVNETDVATVAELMAAVAKADGEVLQLVLEGDKGRRTTEVTPVMVADEPVKRMDFEEPEFSRGEPTIPSITSDIVQQLMQQFGQRLDGETLNDLGGLAEQLLRGTNSGDQDRLPTDLRIEIHRYGNGTADVFVELDGQQYKTDSDHLNILPPEIRSQVDGLVNGRRSNRFNFGGIQIDLDRRPIPREQSLREADPPSLRKPALPNAPQNEDVRSEIDRIGRELDRLRSKLNQIQPNPSEFD